MVSSCVIFQTNCVFEILIQYILSFSFTSAFPDMLGLIKQQVWLSTIKALHFCSTKKTNNCETSPRDLEICLIVVCHISMLWYWLHWHTIAWSSRLWGNWEQEGLILQTSRMKICCPVSFAVSHFVSFLLSVPTLCQVRGAQQQSAAYNNHW